MRKYDLYRYSGIEWLGKIPSHWSVKRLRYVVSERLKYGANESAHDENKKHPRYIRITDFDENGKLRDDTFKSLNPNKAKDYLLRDGDVLFARSGATVGKTFQYKDHDGEACFAGYLIKASAHQGDLNSDYFYLFTKSGAYENWKNSIFNQATIENIGADKYASLELPIPKLEEQTSIASYLDSKTKEIDNLIADKKRLLELYEEEKTAIINQAVTKGINPDVPLKDSGIEWLGEIPEHWEVKKLKWHHQTTSGGTPKTNDSDYYDGNIPWLRTLDLNNGNVTDCEIKITPIALSKSSAKIVPANSVLVAMYGGAGTIGKSGLLKFDASINQAICAILPNDITVPEFLHYFVIFYRPYWMIGAEGTRRDPNISQEDIRNKEFIFPPTDEQHSIVNHIETECNLINSKINKTKKLIELLSEYRTALINEVVTGKIKVTD